MASAARTGAIDPTAVYTANFDMLENGTVLFDVLVPTYLTDAAGRAQHFLEPYQIWMNVSFPALGGPIAGVRDGDIINFDVNKRLLEVENGDDVLRARMAGWKAPKPRYATGVFAKYGALVWSASQGAITTPR